MINEFKGFSQTIKIRMIINFFAVLTTAMVMPYIIIYFTDVIGARLTTLMVIIVGIISLIGYIIGGVVTDNYGRKIIIIVGEIITGIGFLIIAFLDGISTFLTVPFLITFCVIYFFESASNPAYSALIIDASNEDERKSIYSYFIWITSVGFSIGSVVGGFYFESYSTELFLILSITSFIAAILTTVFIKENKPENDLNNVPVGPVDTIKEEDSTDKKGNILSIFLYRLFIFLCLGTFLINLISEQIYSYISIRIVNNYREMNYSITGHEMMGFLHLEDTIIMVLAAGILLKLTKNYSNKAVLTSGLILNMLGYVFLSYFLSPIILILGMIFVAGGYLIFRPVEQTIIASAIPDESRGKHLSVLGLMSALGGMASALFIWASQFISELNITLIFIIIAILITIIYIKVLNYADTDKRHAS